MTAAVRFDDAMYGEAFADAEDCSPLHPVRRRDDLDLLAAGILHGAVGLVWFVRLTLLGFVGFLAVLVLMLG